MADTGRRALAWLLVAVTVAGALTQAALLSAAGVRLLSAKAVDQAFPVITLATLVGAVVGAVIVHRHPRHRIGWLFCLGQAGAAVGLAAQALPLAVVARGWTPWLPAAHRATWLGLLLGANYALALLGLLLLLAPDGRLRHRRWGIVAIPLVGGYLTVVAGLALMPPASTPLTGAQNPGGVVAVLYLVGQLGVVVGVIGASAALVTRQRAARGEERQQLRWISAAAALFALTVLALLVDSVVTSLVQPGPNHGRWYLTMAFYLGYLAVPVAAGFAVLRYRLYGIDVLIGQAVRLAALGAFVTTGYVVVVVVVGDVVGGSSSVRSSLLAFVAVALAFQPVRRRVARFADRVVYGDRTTPYDGLADLGRRLATGVASDRELLDQTARSIAQAVGARRARVTVQVPGGSALVASWPPNAPDEPRSAAEQRSAAQPQLTIPIGGEDPAPDGAGTIRLTFLPGHGLDRRGRQLLAELLVPAGVAVRNVRLTAELTAQADALGRRRAELEASRARLVSAADRERERMARLIRTEVSRHLEDMPEQLPDLAERVLTDPAAVGDQLDLLRDRTNLAIEALRELTGGLVPPLLQRRGLAAAIGALIERSAGWLRVGPAAGTRRWPPSIEVAAYACCAEVLPSLAAGARVALELTGGSLLLTVRGSARPGPPDRPPGRPPFDLQHLIDRVQAVGGQLSVSEPDAGELELRAELPPELPLPPPELPAEASDQTAASRSAANAGLLM
jgi:signal transduction histidine kinase